MSSARLPRKITKFFLLFSEPTIIRFLHLNSNLEINVCPTWKQVLIFQVVCRQLHGFSGAPEQAIEAVVYLRTVYEAGDVDVQLIASKTKLAPLKKQSIPRLELIGTYILSKLVDTVCNEFKSLPFEVDVYDWVDLFTTLCWIKNHGPWKQYVQHRVDVIRKLTDKGCVPFGESKNGFSI